MAPSCLNPPCIALGRASLCPKAANIPAVAAHATPRATRRAGVRIGAVERPFGAVEHPFEARSSSQRLFAARSAQRGPTKVAAAQILAMSTESTVKEGNVVEVRFKGSFEDGTVFEDTDETLKKPVRFTVGGQEVMPGMEQAVLGMKVGEEKEVTCPAADAFGEINDEMIFDVPMEKAPPDIEAGKMVQLMGQINAKCVKINDDDTFTLDLNHEHAGKTVVMNITVVSMEDPMARFPLKKRPEEWKEQLSEFEYAVLRLKGTEPAKSGEYDTLYPEAGYFSCAGCGQPLYSAQSKFDSGCGWPAFDKCFKDSIVTETDDSMGMTRVEIMCGKCGGHMGHVFEGEGETDTNERHCVNSISIKYVDEPVPEGLLEAKVCGDTDVVDV